MEATHDLKKNFRGVDENLISGEPNRTTPLVRQMEQFRTFLSTIWQFVAYFV